MLRLFNMYMYRMRVSLSTWMLIIVLVGMNVLGIVISKTVDVLMPEENTEQTTEYTDTDASPEEGMEVSISIKAEEMEEELTVFDNIIGDVSGGMLLVFLVIFTTLFINADDRHGYIKNIATQVKSKQQLVIPRMMVVAVYTILLFTIYAVVCGITYKICYPDTAIGFSWGAIGFFAIQFVLGMAILSITALVTTLSRSTALGVTTGVLLVTGFHLLFASLGNMLITAIAGKEVIDLNEYLAVYQINSLPFPLDKSFIWALGLGLVYTVVWNILSMTVLAKRDVV